jgi:hypothetical protein
MENYKPVSMLLGACALGSAGIYMCHDVPVNIFMLLLGGVIGWDIGKNV